MSIITGIVALLFLAESVLVALGKIHFDTKNNKGDRFKVAIRLACIFLLLVANIGATS